jgi:uncharacterized damage-inducible protein DinB
MTAAAVHLRHLDDAWSHRWEGLREALAGMTEEEASWQAPCYAAEPREEGWPPPGTIAWQIAHVAHCKRYYAAMLHRLGATERPPEVPWSPPATLAGLLGALEAAHGAERDAVAALTDADLPRRAPNGMTASEFVAMCVRHATWHAAQIAVARRLFRTR